jgi:hypothetical protein
VDIIVVGLWVGGPLGDFCPFFESFSLKPSVGAFDGKALGAAVGYKVEEALVGS